MIEYTLKDFNTDVSKIVFRIDKSKIQFKNVYGIPRGGIPFAIELANALGILLIDSEDECTIGKTLIVDDLIDSGRTIQTWFDKGFDFAVLGQKQNTEVFLAQCDNRPACFIGRELPTEWISFWWEKNDTPEPEQLVTRMLEFIGEDPNRPGLIETPARVAKMWKEIFLGMNPHNRPKIQVVPNGEDGVFYDEMLRDSGYFFSHCEHHLVPFFGEYYFGYIPDKLILGASKIGRLVDFYAARPQIAERLVNQVINDIENEVKPLGSILVMNARHLCKEMRGLKKWNSPYEAIATRGLFRENKNGCKDEFISRLPVK